MRNSTRLAETMEPEAYFDMLNAFFSATAAPVVQHGGEILDFIGDAVLAIFPFESDEELKNAALAANHAVADANSISVSVNRLREAEGLQRFGYGIALNKGEVMFGNIGIPSRLSFSVISPTVNEAARIENKTKELGHSVLADASFARLIPEFWESLGQHQLDGVGHKTELFSWKNGQTG
jgi:adenylate cyclase